MIDNDEILRQQMHEYGYLWDGMFPITREQALQDWDDDSPCYLLYPDDTEGQASSREEIENFDGIFGHEDSNYSEIGEFVDKVLSSATFDWQQRFLNISKEELDKLYEEETLTELQEKIIEVWNQIPEEELNEFIKELN